jgi:hypothetical protein
VTRLKYLLDSQTADQIRDSSRRLLRTFKEAPENESPFQRLLPLQQRGMRMVKSAVEWMRREIA